jgi:hypothetical protein
MLNVVYVGVAKARQYEYSQTYANPASGSLYGGPVAQAVTQEVVRH